MADFSIGEAAGAGFRIIRRKPGAVMLWSALVFVAIFLPVGLLLGTIVPAVMAVVREAAANPDAEPPMNQFMTLYLRMMMLQPLIMVGSLVLRAVLGAAVYRAVLTPEDDAWGYLRLGMRELWVGATSIVIGIIVGFGIVGVMIPGAIIVAIASMTQNVWVIVPVAAVVVLAIVIALIWISLRLSMAVPMSFDANEFRLFESWEFTRGQGGKLFGLVALLILYGIILELIVWVVFVAGAVGIALAFGITPETLRALDGSQNPDLSIFTGPALVAGILFSILISLIAGFAQAVFMAPFAEVYRQLRDSGARTSSQPPYTPHLGEAAPASSQPPPA